MRKTIEQLADKSLMNSTNSFIKLLYFLNIRGTCCKYCKNYMSKSNQGTFDAFGQIYGHIRLNFSVSLIVFKYM